MSSLPRFGSLSLLAVVAVLGMTGCPHSQEQTATNVNPAGDQSSDPAAANLASADAASSAQNAVADNTQQSASAQPSYRQRRTPRRSSAGYANQQYTQDSDYGEQPAYYSNQAPPPLPH